MSALSTCDSFETEVGVRELEKFLVQVNKDGGYANIMGNRLYANDQWMTKPRDKGHVAESIRAISF